jgi:hypothetical protein
LYTAFPLSTVRRVYTAETDLLSREVSMSQNNVTRQCRAKAEFHDVDLQARQTRRAAG